MRKKSLAYLTVALLILLSLSEIIIINKNGLDLFRIIQIISYISFAFFLIKKDSSYLGMAISSIIYAISELIYLLATLASGYRLELSDYILFCGILLLMAMFVFDNKQHYLINKLWFLPGIMIFFGTFIFDLMRNFKFLSLNDLIIYFEPIAILLLCYIFKEEK